MRTLASTRGVQTLSVPKRGRTAQRKTEFVRFSGCEVIIRVCGEMCDGRTDRIYDSDDFPNSAGRGYRCQDTRVTIVYGAISEGIGIESVTQWKRHPLN